MLCVSVDIWLSIAAFGAVAGALAPDADMAPATRGAGVIPCKVAEEKNTAAGGSAVLLDGAGDCGADTVLVSMLGADPIDSDPMCISASSLLP